MKMAAKIVGASIVITIVSYIINSVGAFATMSYYFDSQYFSVWSKIMMPVTGPPPPEFMYYSLGLGFISSLLFVFIYSRIRTFFKDSYVKTGLKFGFGVFLVGSLPGYFMLFLLINLPTGLIAFWAVQSLISNLIGGIIVAKLVK